MKKKINLTSSGIPLVDKTWGGFYDGGTYLLIGARKSGRTLLSLQYAMESALHGEVCLYFTNMRPKDLMIHAASIDFDLQTAMNKNLIVVVKVAPPDNLDNYEYPDEVLLEYINDIVTVVEQYQPSRIVFDEITPFIGFENVNMLHDVFRSTTEIIEEWGITNLFVLGEPVTPAANSIVEALAVSATGIVYLKKNDNENGRSNGGKIIITPNIGHTEGKFSANYYVKPYKGIIDDFKQPSNGELNDSHKGFLNSSIVEPVRGNGAGRKGRKYKSLADIDLPEENYTFSNFYNTDDFKLILNNQIALYKSTGQLFTVLSFMLEKEAERKNLLSINQLQNAIRLAGDRKDKICIIKNKVVVLISKDDQKSVNQLISKIKSNLPNNDPGYIKEILNYISVYSIKANNGIQNAEDVINQLLNEDVKENNRFA